MMQGNPHSSWRRDPPSDPASRWQHLPEVWPGEPEMAPLSGWHAQVLHENRHAHTLPVQAVDQAIHLMKSLRVSWR